LQLLHLERPDLAYSTFNAGIFCFFKMVKKRNNNGKHFF
jgi:hypothetical protein